MQKLREQSYKELVWTDENKKKFWNYWDFESKCEELYFTYALGKYLVDRFSPYYKNAKNVLDFGSGRGYLIAPLIKKGLQVSTIEFSEEAVKHINDKYGSNKYFNRAYYFNDTKKIKKKYDLLFLIEVIEHLSKEELQEDFFNIKNLLDKGARIFITTPHDEALKDSTVYCPNCNKIFHRWQHVRNWNKQSLKDFLIANGFEIVMLDDADLNYEKAKLSFNWRQKVADLLTKKDRHLAYKPHLVCVAKLK